MTGSTAVSDADLHGLVDGHLDLSRRADVLRRLAKAPDDRARVEAWQGQTDLLRSAFGSVQREPLPAMLDLSPRPHLRCVSYEPAPTAAVPAANDKQRPARKNLVAGICLVIALSAGFGWSMTSMGVPDARTADFRLRGSTDEALSARTIAALADMPRTRTELPTLTIPDLEMVGFTFVGAETQSSQPASLLLRYRNGAAESLVISVARSTAAPPRPLVHAGGAYLWRGRDTTYAMAGTIGPERLGAIATALQSDDPP